MERTRNQDLQTQAEIDKELKNLNNKKNIFLCFTAIVMIGIIVQSLYIFDLKSNEVKFIFLSIINMAYFIFIFIKSGVKYSHRDSIKDVFFLYFFTLIFFTNNIWVLPFFIIKPWLWTDIQSLKEKMY